MSTQLINLNSSVLGDRKFDKLSGHPLQSLVTINGAVELLGSVKICKGQEQLQRNPRAVSHLTQI